MKAGVQEEQKCSPFILTTRKKLLNFLPRSFTPVSEPRHPFKYEAPWAPKSVWTYSTRVGYIAPTGIRTTDRSTRSLVSIPVTLHWLINK
jgi:hypothetical protein